MSLDFIQPLLNSQSGTAALSLLLFCLSGASNVNKLLLQFTSCFFWKHGAACCSAPILQVWQNIIVSIRQRGEQLFSYFYFFLCSKTFELPCFFPHLSETLWDSRSLFYLHPQSAMTVDLAEPVCFIASSHCVERRYIKAAFHTETFFIIQMCFVFFFFLNPLRPPFLAVWPRAWNMGRTLTLMVIIAPCCCHWRMGWWPGSVLLSLWASEGKAAVNSRQKKTQKCRRSLVRLNSWNLETLLAHFVVLTW